MDTPSDSEVTRTVRASLKGVSPELMETIEHNPSSTIGPARQHDSAERAALQTFQALGTALGATPHALDIDRTIGEGGMAVVRLATQVTMGRQVAVKTLRGDEDRDDSALRLLREAWTTGALEHPNVVPVYDIGVDEGGRPVIVLKRISGVSWADVIHDPTAVAKRFGSTDPLEWNLHVLQQVCNAVHFAHSRGIIHRDLKPENVMLGEFGEVYLLDWGLAVTITDDADSRLPRARDAKELAGTPAYMAPEQLGGTPPELGPHTDIYLLGAILYEILAGRPPHDGMKLGELFASVLRSNPPTPAGIPDELIAIYRRAMDVRRDLRHESADAFRLALQDYLHHRGSIRLAAEADASRDRLDAVLAGDAPDSEAVHHLLGECRFGYRAALSAWEANERAMLGLRHATLAVVEFELDQKDGKAASVLLSQLTDPPAEVSARVEEALREQEERERKLGRMRQLERDFNPRIGRRARTITAGVLATIWVVTPGAFALSGRADSTSHGIAIAFTATFLVIALALIAIGRRTLAQTLLNRRLMITIVFAMAAQILLRVGTLLLGISPGTAHVFHFFLWFVALAMLTVWMSTALLPAALGYLACFLIAAWHPHWLYPVMTGGNLILFLNIFWLWRPERWGTLGGARPEAGDH